MPHRPVTAQPTRPAMLTRHPHAFHVCAVNVVLEFADELDHRDVLPFHVRAIEIEPHNSLEPCVVHVRDVIAGALDIAHRPFGGVAFEVERDALLAALIPELPETLD